MTLLVLLASASLSVGPLVTRQPIWLIPVALSAALGVIGHRRDLGWLQGLWFTTQVVLAALVPSVPLASLAAVLLSLAAWDLMAHHRRVALADDRIELRRRIALADDPILLRRRHIRVLGIALAVGGTLAAAASLRPLNLGFGSALGLASVVLLSLALVFSFGTSRAEQRA